MVEIVIAVIVGIATVITSIVIYGKARKDQKIQFASQLYNQVYSDAFKDLCEIDPRDLYKKLMPTATFAPDVYLTDKAKNKELNDQRFEEVERLREYMVIVNTACYEVDIESCDKETFTLLFEGIASARMMQRLYYLCAGFDKRNIANSKDAHYSDYYLSKIKKVILSKNDGIFSDINKYPWTEDVKTYGSKILDIIEDAVKKSLLAIEKNVNNNIDQCYSLLEVLEKYQYMNDIKNNNFSNYEKFYKDNFNNFSVVKQAFVNKYSNDQSKIALINKYYL